MIKHIILFTFLSLSVSLTAQISFNTGSSELDADLNDINAKAKVDFGGFKADLSLNYNISEAQIDNLRTVVNMEPAEIFLTAEISSITNNSVDEVVEIYKKNKGKGWGVIAKEAGIKPGSDAFHKLKGNTSSKKNKGNNGRGHGKGNGKSKGKGKK